MRTLPAHLTVLVSGAAALLASPAMAEEGAAKAGLPQLDVSLFPEQLFWLAVTFTVLYVMMRFVALPGVEKVQTKRQDVLDDELSAAKSASERSKAMAAETDRALAEARSKANATIVDIKTKAAAAASEQQAAQSRQLNQKMRDAEAAIATARDAALKDIEGAANDLASAVVDQVTGSKVRA